MLQSLSSLALLVRDYDEAIAFFVGTLGFELVEDSRLDPAKRWVRVRPNGPSAAAGTGLLLARAATPEQLARVGDQTGGRVFLFLETDDCLGDYERLRARGVRFLGPPREEAYGTVVVFEDLYGNRWDLIQPVMARGCVASAMLEALLLEFNLPRHELLPDGPRGQLDQLTQAAFRATEHFIAYGSLAPGGPNHARVAGLPGSWEPGWVEGDLEDAGWGAGLGFPALRWRPGGPRVPAHLLRSAALGEHWAALDRFEGAGYRRILVPFHTDAGLSAVGYLYGAA